LNLLLTHGYFLEQDKREQLVMKPYPPLGILYISAYLKSKGIDVSVYDSTFRTYEDFKSYILTHRPKLVGIYCNLMTKLTVLEMIRFCKIQNCIVLLGGPEPAYYAEHFLDSGADVVIVGEGEITLEILLAEISKSGIHALEHVDGIVFTNTEGDIVRTSPRMLIEDLDKLPFPDRAAIDIGEYMNAWQSHHGRGSVSLITARGCPYTCRWCSHGVFGFSHRRRSPENVVAEIEYIVEYYHPEMLWFADDVFTINHRWLSSFTDLMLQKNMKIPFECISRADRLNEEAVKMLSQLGCVRIWLGSESGSQAVLNRMSRGVQTTEIRNMTKIARAHGIEVGLFVMLGYEGETMSEIEETIAHLKQADADDFVTTLAYPIGGTQYHQDISDKIRYSKPWRERTERDVEVAGRYSKYFYWFAHRRMRNEVLYHNLRQKSHQSELKVLSTLAKSILAKIGMYATSVIGP
jgi:anaerobic magnesium-protoporphyrin IX monomethyl ester cyclase